MRLSELSKMIENASSTQTARLVPDLYDDEYEAMDSEEQRSAFIEEEDFETDFTVFTMTPEQAKKVLTLRGDMTVFDAYQELGDKRAKSMIKDKTTTYDKERIVLMMGENLLDGYHHLIAGILTNNPVKYIDLME